MVVPVVAQAPVRNIRRSSNTRDNREETTVRRLLVTASISTMALAGSAFALEDRVLTLPSDFRTALDKYLIADRINNEDQAISIYANAVAREGARTDGTLPFGSIIVAELHAVKTDADGEIVESGVGRRIPTDLKAIVMMERREGWDDQYPDDLKVGDWEFEIFSPAGENLGKDTTACRECHHPLTDTEYVFTLEHIAAGN